MFNFAGNKIVHQGVHDNPVFDSLHPCGLTGADQLRAQPQLLEAVDDQPGRCAFTDRRIGSQHSDFQGLDRFNFTVEKVKLLDSRRFSNISNLRTISSGKLHNFRVFREVIVQAAIHIQAV